MIRCSSFKITYDGISISSGWKIFSFLTPSHGTTGEIWGKDVVSAQQKTKKISTVQLGRRQGTLRPTNPLQEHVLSVTMSGLQLKFTSPPQMTSKLSNEVQGKQLQFFLDTGRYRTMLGPFCHCAMLTESRRILI